MKRKTMYLVSMIPLILFLLFCFYMAMHEDNKPQKIKVDNIIMSKDVKIQEVQRLEALYEFVQNMDINSYNKEKILKCVDFEIDMTKREVIMNLGKEKYEEMKGKK